MEVKIDRDLYLEDWNILKEQSIDLRQTKVSKGDKVEITIVVTLKWDQGVKAQPKQPELMLSVAKRIEELRQRCYPEEWIKKDIEKLLKNL